MLTENWWTLFDEHQSQIRFLVETFHPAALERYKKGIEAHDADDLREILNETRSGVPESCASRCLLGFGAMCDLSEGIDRDVQE